MTQSNSMLTLSKDLHKHEVEFIELADFIAAKIAIKRGNATLPWTGRNMEETMAKNAEARAYLYTIYVLNGCTDEEMDRFNRAPLDKWRVLPVYADLVIPASVKYDSSNKYEDLLNRSAFILDDKFFKQSTGYGYLMSLDQFNDFTDWVAASFNFDASQCKKFSELRTPTTLADIKNRVAYAGKTDGYGDVPLDLNFRLHKPSRLTIPVLDVTKDYVEAKILENYKRRSGKNETVSSN